MSRAADLPPAVNDTVARVLSEARTQNVLVIGALPIAAIDGNSALRTTRLATWPPPHALRTATYDVAIVVEALSAMARSEAIALLAQLRDVLARRVLVITTIAAGGRTALSDSDFRAYGFRCLQTHEQAGRLWRVHEFSIATYKTTPEWLNARHWAHPERFDKYRW